MLERIRESSRNGLTMVIFAIIMVVFAISFGAPQDGCQYVAGPELLATVDGEDISSKELGLIFNRFDRRNAGADEAQLAQAQSKSLRAMIMLQLLAEEARSVGLRVSDDEFQAYMRDPMRNPEYRDLYGRDGKINRTYYTNYIQYRLGVSIKQYEAFKRRELLARKYIELAEMNLGYLPKELEQLYALRNTEVDLEYVRFSPARLAAEVELTDEEVAAYIAENADAIQKAYDERKDEFTTKDRVRIRRIYLRKPGVLPNMETQEQKDEVKQKMEAFDAKVADAKKRLFDDKENFADVAKELSDDTTYKEAGGLMDWSEIDNMDQNVVQALDGKDIGAIEQVDTIGAMLFVKLEGREESKTTPLEEKQDELARDLMKDAKVDTVIDDLTKEMLAKAKETKSLTKALEELKAEDESTERPDEEPTVPAEDGAETPAEDAPKGRWDDVEVRTTGLFNMDIKQPPNMFGGQLPPELLAQLASWDRVPGIGQSKEIMLAAFDLKTDAPVADSIFDITGDKVIIALKERKEPKEDTSAGDDSGISQVQREKIELAGVLARQAQLPTLGGEWSDSLFLYGEPVLGGEYGPWLEGLYKRALDEGRVKLNKNAVIAQPLLEEDLSDAIIPGDTKDGDDAKEGDAKADDEKEGGDSKDAPAKDEAKDADKK